MKLKEMVTTTKIYEERWAPEEIKECSEVWNLTEEETEKLLQTTQKFGRTPLEIARNKCLLELLYATGMRVSELVSLPKAAVLGQPEMILVKGKGGKERMVPLSIYPGRIPKIQS